MDYPISLTFQRITGYWNASEKGGGRYGTGLYVDGSRQDPRLYEFQGDPDRCDLNGFERSN